MDRVWIPIVPRGVFGDNNPTAFLVATDYSMNKMTKAVSNYLEQYIDLDINTYGSKRAWFERCFSWYSPAYKGKWYNVNDENSRLNLPKEYEFKKLVVHPNIIFLDSEGNRVTEEEKFKELCNA